MIYGFGDCELDAELFELRRDGTNVKLEPKIFNVLAYLIGHRDRVVVKEELLDELWPGQAVSEAVLPSCVAAIRRAVGDSGARQEIIQTVHGRGYHFIAAVHERSAATTDAALPASPLFGRESAMKKLRTGLKLSFSAHGRLILLAGEPGIGKTRTAEELIVHARRHGATVLLGRAYEGEGATAFWPWVQMLRRIVRDSDSEQLAADMGPGAADIAELVSEIRTRLPELPRAEAVEGEQARFRLFDSLTRLFKTLACRSPLVLLIDDLHWADGPSLRLTRFLASELHDARILLVGTYRDVELRRGHPLAELLAALAREPIYERVLLRGLDEADTASMVEHVLGANTPHEVSAAVHEMTEGNPFFIQEVVRLLDSEGGITAGVDLSALRLELPQSVRDAVGRRLDGLSTECNALLRAAAVLGRQFTVTLLERIAELPAKRALVVLAEACAQHVIDADRHAPGRYSFRHALIRQTLYEELAQPERLRLHRRAGEVLEEACGAHPEPYLSELAHHFYEAAPGGDVRKAVETCVRAAQYATGLLAYEQSALLYERAMSALDLQVERDEAARCELMLALAEANAVSGADGKARKSFREAARSARRLARVDLLARAALGDRGPVDMGSPAEETTVALLDEALKALGSEHPDLRARLLSRMAGTPPHANSMQRRRELAAEAYELACRGGDLTVLRDALSARMWATLGPDGVDERLRVAREILALADSSGDKRIALLGHEGLLGGYLLLGDGQAVDRTMAEYAHVAAELRQPSFIYFAAVMEASRDVSRGNFELGEQKIQETFERGRAVAPYAHFTFAGQYFSLLVTRGDIRRPEGFDELVEQMLEPPYAWIPGLRSGLALVAAHAGDVEDARLELTRIKEDEEDVGRWAKDEHWLVSVSALAALCLFFEDRDYGKRLYDLLAPYDGLMVVHDLLRVVSGSVASLLGRLASMLGRYDDAIAHLDDAIAREHAMGLRPAVFVTKASYVEMLRHRNAADDAVRAKRMLSAIDAEAEAVDMRGRPLLDRLLGAR